MAPPSLSSGGLHCSPLGKARVVVAQGWISHFGLSAPEQAQPEVVGSILGLAEFSRHVGLGASLRPANGLLTRRDPQAEEPLRMI